jgi:hypothetical protein
MLSLRRQKSFIFGFSTAFIGRNNDINGYWAPGILCKSLVEINMSETQAVLNDIYNDEFMLNGLSFPHIRKLILRNHDKFLLWDSTLTVNVRYDLAHAGSIYSNGLSKYQGTLTVTLSKADNFVNAVSCFECWPHSQFHESRSTRAAV